MEASAAGLAAASGGEGDGEAQGQQQGQAEGGQGAAGEQGQQQAPGADAVQQFQELARGLADGQEQMRGDLQQFLDAQQIGTGDGEGDGADGEPQIDLSEFAAETDPAKAAERLQQIIDGAAKTQAQTLLAEQLGPVQQQVQEMRQQMEADQLIAKHPDLGEPETAKAVMGAVENFAKIMGQPELAKSVAFVELVYKAGRAEELARQQQEGAAAAPGAATLEGAGGASPGGTQQGADRAAQIAESWKGSSNVLAKLGS